MTARKQRAGRFFARGISFFHSISWAVWLAVLFLPAVARAADAAKEAYQKGTACPDKE